VIVADHASASNPDAVGDTIWLEVDAEQCREVLATATHVGVRVQLNTRPTRRRLLRGARAFFVGNAPTADFVS
jgi:hypothetical protein